MLIENVVKSEMLGKIRIKEKVTQYVYDGQDLITDDQKKRFNENDDTTTDESNGTIDRGQINDDDQLLMNGTSIDDKLQLDQKLEIYWVNVITFALLHVAALYAIYVGVTQAKLLTLPYMYLVGQLTSFGFSCGAHRLWTHRSYKAKAPLQYILAFLFMMSFQHNLYKWCRNHRVHHRYSDTDADPHNIRRGLFFAHIGWLMCQSHPRVLEARTKVYLDDLDWDPVVQFERRYHMTLGPIVWGVLPVLIPYYVWGESLWAAWFTCVIYRYVVTLNLAWSINSLAHVYGNKPYDKHIMATESPINHVLMGESYHNYHHTFPW
ncbi:unnamed protein product [Medioppia subpectinata]|uniref:Fatty acid desaturase domain-containing protein n=1 Tax=Medioppia subpectinata TaxID=1979941 RepID=A0A7R9KZ16_9ACAR|nr:unnamed protein product [Medioppia subpectinata]CAG2111241.1 unnamed protein product [Medioppia subpectinata]